MQIPEIIKVITNCFYQRCFSDLIHAFLKYILKSLLKLLPKDLCEWSFSDYIFPMSSRVWNTLPPPLSKHHPCFFSLLSSSSFSDLHIHEYVYFCINMSVNSTLADFSLDTPHLSSNSSFSYLACSTSRMSILFFTAFSITNTLLLPLSALVLYLGYQRWKRQQQQHSDLFIYHLVAIEMIAVPGFLFYSAQLYGKYNFVVLSFGFYRNCRRICGCT